VAWHRFLGSAWANRVRVVDLCTTACTATPEDSATVPRRAASHAKARARGPRRNDARRVGVSCLARWGWAPRMRPGRLLMRRLRTAWRLPATSIMAVLVLGCGGSDMPASPGAPVASLQSATATVPPTPTATRAATLVAEPTTRPTPAPSSPATVSPAPTVRPTPSPSVNPDPVARPTTWRRVPDQRTVRRTQFLDVVWAGSLFVAIGWSLDGPVTFLTSTDGRAWKQRSAAGGMPTRLAAGPDGLVAVGAVNGRLASWTSADGRKWKSHPRAFPPAPDGSRQNEDLVQVTDVVATSNGWLAVGRRDLPCQTDCGLAPRRAYVWTSADGSRWTRVADQGSFKGGGMNAVTWSSDGFVAVGDASGRAAVWTSADGSRWSRVPDAPMFRYPKLPYLSATDVANRDGIVVAVGMIGYADPPLARAWWSSDGRSWSRASVEKAKGGQLLSVTATPDGFLATGPSGGPSCRGGIWESADGRAWQCVMAARRFTGFGPYAAASSGAVDVAVGLASAGSDGESADGMPGAVWYRTRR
jgi:hypothetical protein